MTAIAHSTDGDAFARFVSEHELRLRQALVARYGVTVGRDATAAALAWAWENWSVAKTFSNPVGYLFRVGQSSTRAQRTWTKRTTRTFPREQSSQDGTLAVDLGQLLAALPDAQRLCVLLVHGHRWSYKEVAELLDINLSSVRNHVHRGTKRLRKTLGEDQ